TGDTMTGNLTITSDGELVLPSIEHLIFNSSTLADTSEASNSGAHLIGAYDEFTNTDSENLQDILADLDRAISDNSSRTFTLNETDPLFADSPAATITNSHISYWNDAYSWGDHSIVGYITASSSNTLTNKSGNISMWTNDAGYLTSVAAETDPVFGISAAAGITSTNISNWNSAYSWGNHATQGYITASSTNTLTNKSGNISMWTNDAGYLTSVAAETDPVFTASPAAGITSTNISNWNTSYGWGNHAIQGYITASSTNTLTNKSGNISMWTNDVGYITSVGAESDPIFSASPAAGITSTNISNWNTSYGWGNHAIQGYITASSTNTLTNKSGNISMWTNNVGYLTSESDTLALVTGRGGTTSSTISFNGSVDFNGNLTFSDQTIVLDAATFSAFDMTGDFRILATNDDDDYIYFNTASDSANLFWEGYTANDPGIRVNPSTNQIEYRDQNESAWTTLDTSITETRILTRHIEQTLDCNTGCTQMNGTPSGFTYTCLDAIGFDGSSEDCSSSGSHPRTCICSY
ncbi:MAG: hypothetical protein PHS44_06265, partial [Candidatus Dojkabacteria bacterium]|nr:hypothetical protein [Candidatus Dojkabacteria bacterium]